MIENKKQYRITKEQLQKFKIALKFAKAGYDAIKSECEVLTSQLRQYKRKRR